MWCSILECFVGTNIMALLPKKNSAINESGIALIVEDDEDIQYLLSIALRELGYEVLCCGNGHTAGVLFEEHSQFIKLAVLDKILPDFNLLEFCEHLRVSNPDLPIIIQTGGMFDSSEEYLAVLKLRVAVLTKPYLPDKLSQAVQIAGDLVLSDQSEQLIKSAHLTVEQ